MRFWVFGGLCLFLVALFCQPAQPRAVLPSDIAKLRGGAEVEKEACFVKGTARCPKAPAPPKNGCKGTDCKLKEVKKVLTPVCDFKNGGFDKQKNDDFPSAGKSDTENGKEKTQGLAKVACWTKIDCKDCEEIEYEVKKEKKKKFVCSESGSSDKIIRKPTEPAGDDCKIKKKKT